MDIYAKAGTRVMFLGRNGYAIDQELAQKHGLVSGNLYTVELTEVSSWHTDVFLTEVPGVGFNSAMFGDEQGYDPGDALVGGTIGPEGIFGPDGKPVDPEKMRSGPAQTGGGVMERTAQEVGESPTLDLIGLLQRKADRHKAALARGYPVSL